MLRWSIGLGRIDILTEVSCLSQHVCSPKEGKIDAVYHIFIYLHKNLVKNPARMEYEPMYEPTDDNSFDVIGRYLHEWKYFYLNAK